MLLAFEGVRGWLLGVAVVFASCTPLEASDVNQLPNSTQRDSSGRFGTRSTDTGACCLPDGECIDGTTLRECHARGGEYQGDTPSMQSPLTQHAPNSTSHMLHTVSGPSQAPAPATHSSP